MKKKVTNKKEALIGIGGAMLVKNESISLLFF